VNKVINVKKDANFVFKLVGLKWLMNILITSVKLKIVSKNVNSAIGNVHNPMIIQKN